MTRLVLIGAGGHGKVVADTAEACGYCDIVFADQRWPEQQTNGRWPIVATVDQITEGPQFCSIGNNAVRARMFDELKLETGPVLAHPSAIISPSVQIGAGTLIVAGTIVNADARIGVGVILNTGCSVDHDNIIEDFVHISPGARLAGGVKVGAGSWIGIGAVVKEGVTIGRNVIVAAGAAVVKNVEDGGRVGGVPAVKI